ncbi:MAG TPA: hypothetical protein VG457_17550 [Planctomycetota bacterium]|jgi:hypothetical protein|nr:hypothetical protein [Planctomycetota bacterium]
MSLKVLSSRESVSLCRAAALLVLGRFRWLAQRADPGDLQLSRLFTDLDRDVEKHLVEILGLGEPGQVVGEVEEQMGQRAARGFLPSLSKTIGGALLDREAGFFLVECILEDLSGFYGAMVRQTCDDQARDLFLRLKQAVHARLNLLHHVVL